MKRLLILLLVSLCAVAWRSEDIMKALMQTGAARSSSRTASVQDPSQRHVSVRNMVESGASAKAHPMAVQEYAELARTAPNAYQKFLASRQAEVERSALDKLMNFFARGKYE